GLNYAIYLIALFASVLVHEFAHAAVGAHYGIKTVEIVMFPIGGVSRLQRNAKPNEEFWISAAGPVANLLISIALFAWIYAKHQTVSAVVAFIDPSDANVVERIAEANLILAA